MSQWGLEAEILMGLLWPEAAAWWNYRDLIFLPSNLLVLGGVVRSEWASTLLGFVEDEDGAAAASAVPSLLPVSTTAKFVLPTTQQQPLLWLLILLLTRMTTGKNDARLGWKTDLTMLDGISADDGCWNRISHSSFCRRLRLLQQLESVMGHQGRKENTLNIWNFNTFFSMIKFKTNFFCDRWEWNFLSRIFLIGYKSNYL